MDSIRAQIALPESEDSWEKIAKAVLQFAELCTHGDACDNPPALVANLKALSRPITSAMVSERTRLSGAAIDLVCAAARGLGTNFEPLLPLFLPTVLILCTRTNKVFLKRAQLCLASIIEGTQLAAILPYLLEAVKDKSATLRLSATDGVVLCLNCFNPPDLEKEARAKEIEAVIKTTARDANVDVRKASRKAFEAYQLILPARVTTFAEPLTPTTKKYLDIKAMAVTLRPVVPKARSQPATVTLARSSSSTSQQQQLRVAPATNAAREMPPPAHVPIRSHTQPPRPAARTVPPARPPLSRPASAASARSIDGGGEPSRLPSEHSRPGAVRPAPMQSHHSTGPLRIPTSEPCAAEPARGGARRVLMAPKPPPPVEPTRPSEYLVPLKDEEDLDLLEPTKDKVGPLVAAPPPPRTRTISSGVSLNKSTSAFTAAKAAAASAKPALIRSMISSSKSAGATLTKSTAGPSMQPTETAQKRSRTISTRDVTSDTAQKRARTMSTLTTSRSVALVAASAASRPPAATAKSSSSATGGRPPAFVPSRAASATAIRGAASTKSRTAATGPRPPMPTARTMSSSTSTSSVPLPIVKAPRTGGVTQPTLAQLARTKPPVVRKLVDASKKPESFKPVKSTVAGGKATVAAGPGSAATKAEGSRIGRGQPSAVDKKPSVPTLNSKASSTTLEAEAEVVSTPIEEKEAMSVDDPQEAPIPAEIQVKIEAPVEEAEIPEIDDEPEFIAPGEVGAPTEGFRPITPALIPLPPSIASSPAFFEPAATSSPRASPLREEVEEEDLAELAATVDALSVELEREEVDRSSMESEREELPFIPEPEETPLPASPVEDKTIEEPKAPLLIIAEPPTPIHQQGNITIAGGERTPISSLVSSIQHGFLFTPSSPLSPPQSYVRAAPESESPSTVRDKVGKFGGLGFGLGLRFGTRKASTQAQEQRAVLSEFEANKAQQETTND